MSTAIAEPPAKPPQAAPAAPEQPIKLVIPKIGEKPAKTADTPPSKPQEKKPDVTNQDDEPEIPTSIMPEKPKSPAQYAREREEAKKRKAAELVGLPDIEKELTDLREYKTRTSSYEQELAREKVLRSEKEARLAEVEARQQELERTAQEGQQRYFEDFRASVNPADDEELTTAHQALRGTLMTKMPIFVPGEDGSDKRVSMNKVLNSPAEVKLIDAALHNYSLAQANDDEQGMDRAVNLMLKAAGAPVTFGKTFADDNGIARDHPAFQKTEEAMREALPAFAVRQQRSQFINEQAPLLVQKQITQREDSIKQNLRSSIFLTPDNRASLAAVNPYDSRVIIGDILESNPALADVLNSHIAATAPALARMGKIQMPTLASNDPQAIAAHRQEAQRYQNQLGEMMLQSAMGRIAGMVIPALMGEIEALRLRAGDAATNTNPGGNRGGEGSTPPTEEPEIPTQIMPKRK